MRILAVVMLVTVIFTPLEQDAAAQDAGECLPDGFAADAAPKGYTCETGPEGDPVVVWQAEDVSGPWPFQDGTLTLLHTSAGREMRETASGKVLWEARGRGTWKSLDDDRLILTMLLQSSSFEMRDVETGEVFWEAPMAIGGWESLFDDDRLILTKSSESIEMREVETGEVLWSAPVTSDWRVSEINAGVPGIAIVQPGSIQVRDLRSGSILWERPRGKGATVSVAHDAIYVEETPRFAAAPNAAGVTRIDPATGETLWEHATAGTTVGQIEQFSRRVVVATRAESGATEDDVFVYNVEYLDAETGLRQWLTSVTAQMLYLSGRDDAGLDIDVVNADGSVETLLLDGATGEVTTRIEGGVEFGKFSLSETVMVFPDYMYGESAGADSGEPPRAEQTILTAVDTTRWAQVWQVHLDGDVSSRLISDGTLYLTVAQPDSDDAVEVHAYDAATGEERWRTPVPGLAEPQWVYDGRLFLQGNESGQMTWHSVETATGQDLQRPFDGCVNRVVTVIGETMQCVGFAAEFAKTVTPTNLWTALPNGDVCTILRFDASGNSTNWYEREHQGRLECRAWIEGAFVFVMTVPLDASDGEYDLTVIGGNGGATPATPGMLEPGVGLEVGVSAVIVGGDIPLRGAPAPSGVERAVLPAGTTVELVGGPHDEGEDIWWQVRDPVTGKNGYIPAGNLAIPLT